MFNLKYTLCRTCLEALTESNGFNIFMTEQLAHKLISCTGQPVDTNDVYPQQLCQKCYENTVMFYKFQQMCCKSLKSYLVLLETETTNEKQSNTDDNAQQDAVKPKQLFAPATEKPKRKKTSTSRKRICSLKDEKLEYSADVATSSSARKNFITGVTNAKKDLKACLPFDEVNSENIKNVTEPLDKLEQASITCSAELPLIDVLDKDNEAGQQQQTKEIILTDGQECVTLVEKQEHQCHRCSLKFKTLYKLQAHLRQHEGLPPYLCSYKGCECSFDRWHSYKKHQQNHYDRQQQQQHFKCDMGNCERVYKNKSNLNVHKRKFHHFGPELKTHMCEVCGKVFKSSAVLNDHRFTHIDRTQLPYACEEAECSKRFSTKEKLKIHKMRHAGIKNFVCPHCGMRKTTRNELKIHINYHTLERTWPCRFCPKVCNSAGNLKMHIKNIHEGAKDFACRFCQRTFAKADTKKYHEMTHTGEKPNECQECGRRFVQPAALRTHRKIHLRQKEKMLEKQNFKPATASSKETKVCTAVTTDETDLLTESIVAEILNDAATAS